MSRSPSDDSSKPTGKNAFTLHMVDYIKENFADVLGADVELLTAPGGLESLRDKYSQKYHNTVRKAA